MVEIHIDGSMATIHKLRGVAEILDEILSFDAPERRFSSAYRNGKWDGKVRFYDTHTLEFGAGLTHRVAEHLRDLGHTVKILSRAFKKVDLSDFDETYLDGITLWPHQMELALALLNVPRGTGQAPTGSGKTAVIAAIARLVNEQFGWRTLILVPNKTILTQTYAALPDFFSDISVGIVGDGQREEGEITVALPQTVINFKPKSRKVKGRKTKKRIPGDLWLQELVKSTDLLILDEVHRGSSKSWQTIANACRAKRRYGVSATPRKGEGNELDDLRLEAAAGQVVCTIPETTLIDAKLCAKPKIVMLMCEDVSGPDLPMETTTIVTASGEVIPILTEASYPNAYQAAFVDNQEHNAAVVLGTRWMIQQGRSVIVLCKLKAHFELLSHMLEEYGVSFMGVWGETATADREVVKEAFAAREIDCVLATKIWDEGADIGGVNAMIFAEGGKSPSRAVQRVGRGMRKDSEDVWVLDIVPTCHEVLSGHGEKRAEAYEARGYEVVVQDTWTATRRLSKGLLPFLHWEKTLAAM